jgi:putative restriction endonuclease
VKVYRPAFVTADPHDRLVRTAAFDFLAHETALRDDGVLPYEVLSKGFEFDGTRVPLLGPQGIFKPRVLREMPLSITTAPVVEGRPRPYDDRIGQGEEILYRYRGEDPSHHENVGLRRAMQSGTPLVYLYGLLKGFYVATWPVYVVGDDPARLTFTVMVDDAVTLRDRVFESGAPVEADLARRRYITVQTQQRLHQKGFRLRVLDAYRRQCAICRLRHEELLSAAHILADGHARGDPIVPNGLALCELHHRTFDRNLIAIRPDLTIEVRRELLDEHDGPMLDHGIKGFHGLPITVPSRRELRPDRERLEIRYEEFKRAACA